MDADWLKYAHNSTITQSPTITTTSVVIAPVNIARKGLLIYNASANTVYVGFAATTSSANKMTIQIAAWSTWQMGSPVYTGIISAVRNSGTGSCLVTELT